MRTLIVSLLVVSSSIAHAEVAVEVELGGGSVIAWDASGETGNAFGGAVLLGIGDLSVGLGAAAVMPDSRLQGEFGAYWAEARWEFLGREGLLSPYGLVGLGFSTADGFEVGGTGFVPARWSSAASFVGMLGAGARFGKPTGMYFAADVRAWNHTHLGLQLAAGFRFY